MSGILFDTCFLIDLERERRRGAGGAHDFLEAHRDARPYLTWVIVGEWAEGFGEIRDPACAAMIGRFEILPFDEATAGHYARVTSRLRRLGTLIGTNDLWIAAASLAHQMPLVTKNAEHFNRVPGLQVVGY